MKLGPDMCHLNTINIPKHEGVNEWVGGGGANKKPQKRAVKLRISTFASSNTNSDNTKVKGIFSLTSITT